MASSVSASTVNRQPIPSITVYGSPVYGGINSTKYDQNHYSVQVAPTDTIEKMCSLFKALIKDTDVGIQMLLRLPKQVEPPRFYKKHLSDGTQRYYDEIMYSLLTGKYYDEIMYSLLTGKVSINNVELNPGQTQGFLATPMSAFKDQSVNPDHPQINWLVIPPSAPKCTSKPITQQADTASQAGPTQDGRKS